MDNRFMFIQISIDLCTFLVNQRQNKQRTKIPCDLHGLEK